VAHQLVHAGIAEKDVQHPHRCAQIIHRRAGARQEGFGGDQYTGFGLNQVALRRLEHTSGRAEGLV
jgi:hypothetical protein